MSATNCRVLPVLRTGRTVVRLAEREEAAAVLAFYLENKEHLKHSAPAFTKEFFTESYWTSTLENQLNDFCQDRSLRMYIFLGTENTVIGHVSFGGFMRRAAQFCYLGYGLAKLWEGQGYMTEALRVSIQYVFEELNMHRIMANYMPNNSRSAAVLQRLGFEREGFARQYLCLDGRWEDHILTSLINEDWHPDRA